LRATRTNLGYLIAAAGGLLLFLSLFLSWFSIPGGSASLWEIFSGVDILLAILGLAVATLAGGYAVGSPPIPVPPVVLQWLGIVAVTLVVEYLLESDNADIGAFIGLLASAAILAGAILADRPDLTDRVADATGIPADRPAAAPRAGFGSSTATPTPPAAAPAAAPPGPAPAVQPATGAGAASPAAAPTPPAPPAPPAGGERPAPARPAESVGPPPGWYPDPQGQARLRYWDGTAWTEQTSA
jgi:hypothetical protein